MGDIPMRKIKPVSEIANILSLICFIWLVLPATAKAKTLQPPPGANLAEIVHLAANGDRIELSAGDYAGPIVADGKTITIVGASPAQTRITGNAQTIAAAINGGGLILEKLTLAGNGQTDIGFIGQNGALTGRSLIIADVKQAFIQQQSNALTLEQAELRGSAGRGVLLTDAATAKFADIVMENVKGDVGLFLSKQSRLTMDSGSISDMAQHAVYGEESELTLQAIKIDRIGGRMLVAPKSLKAHLTELTVSNVKGDTAIFVSAGSELNIKGGRYSNLAGAGIYAEGSSLAVDGAYFGELGGMAIASMESDAELRSNIIQSVQAAIDIRSGNVLIEGNKIARTAKGYPAIRIGNANSALIKRNSLSEIDFGVAVSSMPGGDVSISENTVLLASASALQVLGAGQERGAAVRAEGNLILGTGRDTVSAAQSGSLILRNNRIFSSGETAILAAESATIDAQNNVLGAISAAMYSDKSSGGQITAENNQIVFGDAPSSVKMNVNERLHHELSKASGMAEPVRQAFLAIFETAKTAPSEDVLDNAVRALEAQYQAIGAAVADYRNSSAFPVRLVQIGSPLPVELRDPSAFHDKIVDIDGRLHLQFRDMAFSGRGYPLEIVRSYHDGGGVDSPFGPGWRWNWGQKVLYANSQRLMFRQQDGAEVAFVKQSGDRYAPLLGLAGSAFTLRAGGGFERHFADGNSEIFSADGLLSRANRQGPVQFLNYGGNSQLQSVETVSGQALRFTYDGNRLARADGPEGSNALAKYTYDNGRLSASEDALGRKTLFSYNDAGLLTRIVFADGSELSIERSADGRVAALKGPGKLSAQIDISRDIASGKFSRKIVDATGVALTRTAIAKSDDTLEPGYGEDGNEIRAQILTGKIAAQFNEGAPVTLSMAGPDAPLSAIGGLISGDYAGMPAGETAERQYDGRGFPMTIDVEGRKLDAAYDNAGHLVTMTGADDGKQRKFSYDAAGQITAASGGGRGDVALNYDSAGRVTQSGDRKISYSAEGLVQSIQGPDVRWTYDYDAAGRVTKVTQGDQFLSIGYDHRGNPNTYRDEKGNSFNVDRERPGQVKMKPAEGKPVEIEFGSDGLPRKVMSDGKPFAEFSQQEKGKLVIKKGEGTPETVPLAAGGEGSPALAIPSSLAIEFLSMNAGTPLAASHIYSGGIPLQMPFMAEGVAEDAVYSEAASRMISPSAGWSGAALAALGVGGLRALGPVLYGHHVVEYLNGNRSTGQFLVNSAIFGAGLAFPGNPISAVAAAHGLGSLLGQALAEYVINEINDPNSRDGRIYERLFGVYREEHANHPCSKRISCDCQGIEAGLLTGPWRADCRTCERGIREQCMRAVANGTPSPEAVAAAPRCNNACSVYGDNYQPR